MESSESIIINRPRSEVWPFVGHPNGWQNWINDISDVDGSEVRPLSEGDSLTYKYRGRPVTSQVARYQHECVLGIHSSEKNYEFHESISLEDDPKGTKATFTMGFDSTVWWLRVLAVIMNPVKGLVLGKPLRKTLTALKQAVEAGDTRK